MSSPRQQSSFSGDPRQERGFSWETIARLLTARLGFFPLILIPICFCGVVLVFGLWWRGVPPFDRKPTPTIETPIPAPDFEPFVIVTTVTPPTPIPPTTVSPGATTAVPPTTIVPTTAVPPTTLSPVATTVVPTTSVPPAITTVVPTTVTPLTPTSVTLISPDNGDAEAQAEVLAPQVLQKFRVIINPSGAKGLDDSMVGGQQGQLASMIAPVIDEKQKYVDNTGEVREVMGLFTLNDPRLSLEALFIQNKQILQLTLVPTGSYILACHPSRINDCMAVSFLRGQEFLINPETVTLYIEEEEAAVPTVSYESGSIKKCYKVLKRKICVRIFR